jgi:glutaminyl-tRNA synthetase
VKSTLHWVSATENVEAEVRLYDRLFNAEDPANEKDTDFRALLNPDSLTILPKCFVEPHVKDAKPLDHFQFERLGYFNVDKGSTTEKLIFNRTVTLRDNWSKQQVK